MTYEVVVVGGGIGGLTTAALLAARGVDVCLLERESALGGCAGTFQKFDLTFESSIGLHAGWGPDGIHQRVFAELAVKPPETHTVDPGFAVRLPDGSQVLVTRDSSKFEQQLQEVFPECSREAVQFYRALAPLSKSIGSAMQRVPDLRGASKMKQLSAFFPDARKVMQLRKLADDTVAKHLNGTSNRFRSFLNSQLQTFTQSSTDECSYLHAAVVLENARNSLFVVKGGGQALCEALANAIKASGGNVRLNSPVLRLAYDSSGRAKGVDLLSGETVEATRAIISNLTVWDTYGKLIGLNQTPNDVRKAVSSLEGTAAYVVYAAIEASAVHRLPAERILTLTEWPDDQKYDERFQLNVGIRSQWEPNTQDGKRSVTLQAFTDATEWFAFHEDESEHEDKDQATLETYWQRLHAALPELGGDIEIIDTATPRTLYENTRRKLGMVGTVRLMSSPSTHEVLSHRTFLPNVFRVGDTAFPGVGLAAASYSGLIVADQITR